MTRKRRRDERIVDDQEVVDSQPRFVPIKPTGDPQADYIRALVRSEQLAIQQEKEGYETFAEADDFDTGEDDYQPSKYEYEENYDPEMHVDDLTPQERKQFLQSFRDFISNAHQGASPAETDEEPAGETPPVTNES